MRDEQAAFKNRLDFVKNLGEGRRVSNASLGNSRKSHVKRIKIGFGIYKGVANNNLN